MLPGSSRTTSGGLTCAQLRVSDTNRRLWTEHVLWTRFFIISTAFCLPDLPFDETAAEKPA